MIRRMSIVGLVVTLVTGLLPAQVFADETRSLASLRTSTGLQNALEAAQVVQDPTRRVGAGVQVQRQQGDGFFSTTAGKVTIAALIVAGAYLFVQAWNNPEPRRVGERPS